MLSKGVCIVGKICGKAVENKCHLFIEQAQRLSFEAITAVSAVVFLRTQSHV